MELRDRLQLEHKIIQQELLQRSKRYIVTLLGDKTDANREAYENNRRTVLELMNEKKEYMIPSGSYLFSTENHLQYKWTEEADVLAECIVVFCLKEYKTEDAYEQYMMHLIQIAMMNAVRDYMKEVMVPQMYRYLCKEKAPYISNFFGPGLFDEPLSAMKEMLKLTKEEAVTVADTGVLLSPDMSFTGALYVTKKEIRAEAPCISCKAKIGCEYCMKKR